MVSGRFSREFRIKAMLHGILTSYMVPGFSRDSASLRFSHCSPLLLYILPETGARAALARCRFRMEVSGGVFY